MWAEFRETVRERPELLLIPMAALLLAVNLGPWGFGPIYLVTFVLYFTLQRSNAIFPLTWSLSLILFGSTLWIFLSARWLTWWRTVIVAGTLPFLAVTIFEIPYDLGVAARYSHGAVSVFDLISISTWLAVGLTSLGWWRLSRVYWAGFAGFALTYAVWYALGFPTIDRASGTGLEIAFAFNIALKIWCFPLAGLPVWQEWKHRKSVESPPVKSTVPA